uniref:lectin-like domain-containing protein n=1 Tax=Svornostia abyssi TaxID=2898438 RepID=UPI00338F5A1A
MTGGVVAPPPPPPPPAPSQIPDPTAGGWQLNGTSSIAGGTLQLTPAASDARGSAFYPSAVDVGSGITVEFDATIADGTGADGLAMVLADPARGATATSLGGGGGSLGFGGIPGIAVGLSTYPSSAVGISDGALTGAWQTLNWVSTAQLLTPLQNTTKRVKVTITRTTVTAVVDGGVTVTKAMAVPERVLVGFSAATGGLTNRHAVKNVSVAAA